MGELNTAISIKNLAFSYGEKAVLQNTSVEIQVNKLSVILGKNGSGKSTLLKIIAGLLPYKQGEIEHCNVELKNINLRNRAKIFGFLGQKHKAVFPFTVEQVVLTGRAAYVSFTPQQNDFEITEKALSKVGIEHLKNRYYTELSGGEQQLVMIARELAQEPKILLLDEPTTHLDFCNQVKLMSLLKELTQNNLTIVAVLHDPNIAFLYGDDFIFLKNGQLIKPAAPVQPWDAAFLQNIYETPMQSIPHAGRALIVPLINEL